MEQQPFVQYDPNYALPPEQNPYYKKRERQNLSRIGLAFTVYMVFLSVVQVAMVYLCQWLFPSFVNTELYTLLLQVIPAYLLGFPLFACLLIGMPKKSPKRQPLKAEGWITFLAVAFFLMLAGNYIANGLMAVIETIRGTQITNAIDQQITTSSTWLNLVLIVLIAPVIEELMCRKLVIDRLLPYSETLAVVTGGLIFGLLHGNFYQFFYATLLGMLFSYVYVKTGNILHTILMHMIINFTGAIISDFISKMTSDLVSAPTSINPWAVLGSVYSLAMMTLAVCGAVLFVRKLKNHGLCKTGDRYLTLSTQFRLAWLNPGMAVYGAVCLLMFAGSLFI